jgi:apolipoprotein D and lipocalin family protein
MRLITVGCLVLGGLVLVIAGCTRSTEQEPLETVGQLDLQRYQGTWYELARLPLYFQRKCAQSQAQYQLRGDGKVSVLNRCRTLEGEWIEASGQAEPQQPGQTDKLWVTFDNWFSNLFPRLTRGAYWVLYVDPDYQVALVGEPSRKYLWLLSRQPQVSPSVRDRLLSIAQERGYQTDGLIWRRADSQINASLSE